MTDDARWKAVDAYFSGALLAPDPTLDAALDSNAAAGMPAHDVSPSQGQFLSLLARATDARRVLEIGTLGGYSSIWFARSLGPAGRVISLEIDPDRARIAQANLLRAGVSEKVEIKVGRAVHSLEQLARQGVEPFDIIFIDADKPSNPQYLEWALRLSRRGTLIIADNVVRNGAVADAASEDPNVVGVRTFIELLAREPRVQTTALQTVGAKGYDGFAMALVHATA